MLGKNEFKVLNYLYCSQNVQLTQRIIAEECELSLGTINAIVGDLNSKKYINDTYDILAEGYEALKPYRAKNAIIMAAGLSSRFVPLSCEKPKGLLEVKGEILIERQIKQLQEVGIKDIYVVVGYMMEQFFYLEEKFGVTIIVNPNYRTRNNNGSLYVVRQILGNSYICSSDNYFTENVFETYIYDSYYASTFINHDSTELYIETDNNDRIIRTFHGGKNHWALLGHSYLSDAFCEKYVQYLLEVYDKPETRSIYWEWIFYPHLDEMVIYARKYKTGIIWEFDSLAELREFDNEFLNNIDSTIMMNICELLKCKADEISDIKLLENGRTNMSFSFIVHGKKYVYRNSGEATDKYINRKSEEFSCEKAKEIGLDPSLIYMDSITGFKLMDFIESTKEFSFDDPVDVENGIRILHKLHDSNIQSPFDFDYMEQVDITKRSMNAVGRKRIKEFDWLHVRMERLASFVKDDKWQKSLGHGDARATNFIVNGDDYILIDWEYSGNRDIGFDIAHYCAEINRDVESGVWELTAKKMEAYFRREVTKEEYRHILACFALDEYYWFVWAINLVSLGQNVEDCVLRCYKNSHEYGKKALALYE